MPTIAINKISSKAIAKLDLQGRHHDVLWFLLGAAHFDNEVEISQAMIGNHFQIDSKDVSKYIKVLSEKDLITITSKPPKFKTQLNLEHFESVPNDSPSTFPPSIAIYLSTQTAILISKLKLQGRTHDVLWYLMGASDSDNILNSSQQIIAQQLNIHSHQVSAAIQHLQDNSIISTIQRQPFIAKLNTILFNYQAIFPVDGK